MQEAKPSKEPINKDNLNNNSEVEVNNLDTIIISRVVYVFMHDLEKSLEPRLDECLSIICMKLELPFDNKYSTLEDKLLPLVTLSQKLLLLC